MNILEIILYVLTAVSVLATLVGYVIKSRRVTMMSLIALAATTLLWAILDYLNLFPS